MVRGRTGGGGGLSSVPTKRLLRGKKRFLGLGPMKSNQVLMPINFFFENVLEKVSSRGKKKKFLALAARKLGRGGEDLTRQWTVTRANSCCQ